MKRGLQRSVLIFLLLVLAACAHRPEKKAASPQPASRPEEDLNLLVQQYWASADPEQGAELLKEIQRQKGASIEAVEKSISEGGLYPPKALVGSLHSSIDVGAETESYALYVPENYDPAVAYPLIVCLHGAGFTGDTYLERWETRLGEKALLVCPTMEDAAWWTPDGELLVLSVIGSIQTKYHIDPDRIYLTGMSNGGIGAYLIGSFYADRFAAIAPMAGGIPDEVFPLLQNLRGVGIYIIHGSKDEVMPVTLSRKINDYLQGQGIEHVYREHNLEHPMAGGHFFPKDELPGLISWLNEQRRNPTPSRVTFVRDRSHTAPLYWIELNVVSDETADVLDSISSPEEAARVKKGAFAKLTAEARDNQVIVESEGVQRYTLFFNRKLIDFSKPVVVMSNGRRVFEGKLSESVEQLLSEAKRRQDRGALYPASITIDLQNRVK